MIAPMARQRRRPPPARSARSRRSFSTCRDRCGSTAGASCTRSASPTRPTDAVAGARQRHPGLPRAQRRRPRGRLRDDAAGESTRDGFGAEERDGTAGKGLGWWDGMIGPGKAFDTDRFFVVSHQPARRLPRDDGTVVDRSGDRPALRVGLPGHHRRGHGAHGARVPRRARHRAARGGGRRLARRHAGARVGDPVPRPGRRDRSRSPARTRSSRRAWPGTRSRATRSRRDPDWQGGHYYGTGRAPDAGHGRGADGRPHHVPVGARRSTTSSAGGCSSPTTSATRSPSRSSRSRATCATRPTRSSSASTPTPTSTRRGR